MFHYKTTHTLEQRRAASDKLKTQWPNRIPIIIQKSPNSALPDFAKQKFICPETYSSQKFMSCLRKKLQLRKELALFVFVNGTDLVTGDTLMRELYASRQDEDGFVYMTYSEQEVLG